MLRRLSGGFPGRWLSGPRNHNLKTTWNLHCLQAAGFEGTPTSQWESLLTTKKYCKGLYGDLSDRYLEFKNSNKDTSEFITLCPCLNLLCFLSIFGRFRAIPASFISAVVCYIYINFGLLKQISE